MFTIRNLGGVALFLFGTTFLWLTPAFASRDASTRGSLWAVTQVLALAALLGFSVATWGLFTRGGWWETVALVAAAVGALSLVPFWVAAHRAGETTPWWNVLVHAVGIAGVLTLLLVPRLEAWVSNHVMAAA